MEANILPAPVAINTDIIVGFPGESEDDIMETYYLLEDLRLDSAHLARYSPRPGTVSARNMSDDVPEAEKMRRFRLLESQQERIVGEINAVMDTISGYVGSLYVVAEGIPF